MTSAKVGQAVPDDGLPNDTPLGLDTPSLPPENVVLVVPPW